MEENQKNKENKQEVSETKNNPQEGSPFPKDDEIEDRESYSASCPPGYKFNPTDEDLIIHYLKPKNLGQRLPPNKIVDINLYEHSPQQLYQTYNLGEKMVYFFTPRDQKYRRGTLLSRSAADGFWKSSRGYVLIGNPENPTGYKNTLVFYKGNSRESTKTNWVMQEYTTQKSTPSTSRAPQNMTMDVWVLCRLYNNSAKGKEETNAGQSDLESTLSAGTLPPGLDHVNSQRPAHTGENSFPKPQLYQNPLASVKPQPPGPHNFNHSISAQTGGYRVPKPCSNQDLLSARPPPSEMSNIHSGMTGNSGQTPLHKPDEPGFQNVNSQMAAHNTGESYSTNPPISAHTVGYRVPMPHSNQDLLSTRPPTSEMYNTPWMSGNSGQTFLPKPDQSGFQDPLLLNNAHPSGMCNTYSHMPQFPPLDPTIPHFSGMFNRYPHLLDNAHMYGNTGHNSFPKLQTNQHLLYLKSPRLPDQTNQDQPGFQNVNSQMAAHNAGESYCHKENPLLSNIVPHGELPSSVLKPQSNQDLSLLNGYNTNDFPISNCNGQINGYDLHNGSHIIPPPVNNTIDSTMYNCNGQINGSDCGDHKYSQDLSTGLVHDSESLFIYGWMQDFPGVPAQTTEFEVPLPDYDFSSSDGFFDYPELHDSVPGDKAQQVP